MKNRNNWKVKFIYLSALLLVLFNFLMSIIVFFDLVEHYEPYFSDLSVEDMQKRLNVHYPLIQGELSMESIWKAELIILALTFLGYIILRIVITIYEEKKPEIKNLFLRNLFMKVPVQIGIGFLVVSFWYTLFALFDVSSEKFLFGVMLKFVVTLLVFVPIMLYNIVLLRREGKSFLSIFLK